MTVVPSDPSFWANFSFERTPKTSKFTNLLVYKFVNFTIRAPCTNRDIVKQVAAESKIPIESLPADLDAPVLSRGRTVFDYIGNALDAVAENYNGMKWWVSDAGLNMAILPPAHTPRLPTFNELMPPRSRKRRTSKRPARRKRRDEAIDIALKLIAESNPHTQQEVFRHLAERHIVLPSSRIFEEAGSWMAVFRTHEAAARTWLSRKWKALGLTPLPRGPKRRKK